MVEFKLTKEQLLAKELFRSFAENEIKPISRDMDEAEKFDMDLLYSSYVLFFVYQYFVR